VNDDQVICDGCKKEIKTGEECWVSDIGEERVLTHAIAECLIKVIAPEPGWISDYRKLRLVE
jgi:hypothetical protein